MVTGVEVDWLCNDNEWMLSTSCKGDDDDSV